MPKTIKYTGAQERWPELAVTGKQSAWRPGQQEERSDSEALLLLGTGQFQEQPTKVVFATPDQAAAFPSLVSGAGIPGSRTYPLSIALAGDSITWNQAFNSPIEYPGYERGLHTTALVVTNLNAASSSGFIPAAYANAFCATSDTVTLAFDGVKSMTVNVGGEGAGVPVDVTGGGYFHLVSAGGQKGALVQVRWDPRAGTRPGAVSDTTSTALGNNKRNNFNLGTYCATALARIGVSHYTIRNWGISGDTTTDLLNRLPQILATAPTIVLLMIGINDYTDVGAPGRIRTIVSKCNAAGAHVWICTTFPPNAATTANASAYANLTRQILLMARSTAYSVTVFDGASLMLAPLVQTGNGILPAANYPTGNIHPYWTGLANAATPMAASIGKLLPSLRPSLSSVMDVYDATYNPQGNLLGTSGQFLGTTGALNSGGVAPTATGELGTAWTEGGLTASTGATIVYTSPSSASPVPRADGLPGFVQRIVVNNSAGSGAIKRAAYRSAIAGLSAGMRVRLHIAVRVTNATRMNTLDAYLQFNVSSGPYSQIFLTEMANNAIMDAAGVGSIADTGMLYLSSDSFLVPDLYSSAIVQVNHGCAQGGSYTLDLDDVFVEILA